METPMTKTRFLTSLAAACWLAAAAPQVANDAPGVTVSIIGATVIHRTGVKYPSEAQEHGVQGTISVEVKLDSAGNVSDAQVLSGPQELRRATLESVLQWHFTQDAAGSTRLVSIAFGTPQAGSAPAVPPTIREVHRQNIPGHIDTIQFAGISEQAAGELRAKLPVREGDEWNADANLKTNQVVKAFDEHLSVQMSGTTDLVIAAPGAGPARITVGGNVQAAMIIKKVAPVYPAAAKAARISGVVRLAVVIGYDGAIQSLTVLDGPPELAEAATDAVRQWVYHPTLLNGNPAQVQTTIDVNFVLNR
jgi:TonB family protein